MKSSASPPEQVAKSRRKVEKVQSVVDDARKVNTSLTKGNYGTEAARLWGALRNGINDLARAYGIAPLGV